MLDADELAEIRSLGEAFMTTPVKIFRGTVIEVAGPSYDVNYDYGDDDLLDDVQIYTYNDGDPVTTNGWFFSTLQTGVEVGGGQMGTIDLHELRLPWGTDIRPHDLVERVDNSERYEVIDTNGDDTWAEELKATLRRRE